ncbi:MAG: hypothetical protein FWC47_01465 [Oscillospiraceae bacterium]|nr:hypothetical protein [Oscillospiraceae bacterium]
MSQNKNFSRYFIILQESDKGYGITPNKVPTGYAKVECRNNKCKITFYVQNLKKDNILYYMFLIASKKNTDKLINLGHIKLDNTGRAEVSSEYDQDNISGTNISFDKISGAALVVMNNNQIVAPLVGFNTADIPDYKNFKILNMYMSNDKPSQEKKEEQVKNEPKEATKVNNESKEAIKVNYEKYENEIEKNKAIVENKLEKENITRIDETPEVLDKELDEIPEITSEELGNFDNVTKTDVENPEEKSNSAELDEIINRLSEINKKGLTMKELKPVVDELNKVNANMLSNDLVPVIENISKMKKNTPSSDLDKEIDRLKEIRDNIAINCHCVEDDAYEEYQTRDEMEQYDRYLNEFDDEYIDRDIQAQAGEGDLGIDNNDTLNSALEREIADNYDSEYELEDGIGEEEYTPYDYEDENLRQMEDQTLERIDEEDNDFPTGNVGKFFKDAMKDFDKVKNFIPEIKNTKWYRVNVDDLDNMLDDSDHNKYTIAYYPMISYYPYFGKFKHYIIGLKHDDNGKMKYLIYGIPGSKDKYSQPLDGKTGYVIWIPFSNDRDDDIGYWLMFYDFRNSTVLIPEK